MMPGEALLTVRDLTVNFGPVRAVSGATLTVSRGPFGMAIVGESGSGKTTLGRAILRLVPASGGTVEFDGQDVLRLRGRRLREFRRAAQIVFQDADGSLDPRMRIGPAIREVLAAHGMTRGGARNSGAADRVAQLLSEAALDPALASRYPHQLSGGQRQRAAIARALAVSPRLLVLDEPTSALDVTAQARVLDTVRRLRAERGLAYLLITHNLAIASSLCEQLAVLYLGRIVETGPAADVLATPAHPYTMALRAAVPQITGPQSTGPEITGSQNTRPQSTGVKIDPAGRGSRIILPGEPPDAASPPPGCPFHPRCPLAIDTCRVSVPASREVAPGRRAACHRADEVLAGEATAS
ncbi:MAG: ABC transporter ATP-binding protein [Nocardiopsaceae bacterium]|nr:ABC transporter ATP-binding protein [Nocardiopsaceae bacterium]